MKKIYMRQSCTSSTNIRTSGEVEFLWTLTKKPTLFSFIITRKMVFLQCGVPKKVHTFGDFLWISTPHYETRLI